MTTPELAPWLQRYFTEYLSAQRNVSHATITAYRDTFRLLLKHLRKTHRRCSHTLSLEILTSDTILRFLDDLEQQRGNSIRTRNARLAAIRSFVHYLSDWLGPELPVFVARILAIPFKRYVQVISGFLNRQEVEAILTRLSQLEGLMICKPLQISATFQKVCTKLTLAAVGLSA